MFRITDDPSSGSLVQCLAKTYRNDSIVSVDMDKVGVMAAYSDPLCVCVCVCVVHCIYAMLSSVAWLSLQYFCTLSNKRRDFKNVIEHKMCILILSTTIV